MNLVSELDLPAFDFTAADFSADRYHQQLAETRQHGWLAKSPLAYIVLDHDAGEFFLRSRKTVFPGRQIAELFGVTDGPLAEHVDANILNLAGDQHRRLRALAFLAPRTAGLALDGPPQLGGVEGIYGIDKLPVIWPGSSEVSPNDGPGPDVS
jgi:hypothetical protein